jgi:hypothetical protein
LDAISQVLPPSLDFSKGKNFESEIKRKFGHSVNFVPGFRKREFYLVASFGRANFKLNFNHALEGWLLNFMLNLQGRVFQFSVSSRAVGFDIYNSGKFSKKDFDLYVHLWGNGGPN